MQFSIIIPTYNYAQFVQRAIDSALAQTGEDFEILVVDDGSTDETTEILKQYQDKIQIISQENKGVAVARNHGAEKANGEYLLFLDADDALESNALELFRNALQTDKNTRFILAGYCSVDECGNVNKPTLPKQLRTPLQNFRRFINRKFSIAHGAILMRRDNFDIVQYPPGITNGEDVVLFAQSLILFSTTAIPAVTVKRFAHSGRERNRIDRIRKGGIKTVDLLFRSDLLPKEAMRYRNQFLARRHASLARSFFKAKCYPEAKEAYWNAFKANPRLIFNLKAIVRFLQSAWS